MNASISMYYLDYIVSFLRAPKKKVQLHNM